MLTRSCSARLSSTGPSAAALSKIWAVHWRKSEFLCRAIDLDMQIGRCAIGVSKLENVLTFPAIDMSADDVGRGTSAASGIDNTKAGKGRSISINFYSCIGVMATTFGDSKRRAAAMDSSATAHRYASGRMKLDGGSSRHERRAGCMWSSLTGWRCVGRSSRLEALPTGCPLPEARW